MNQVVSVTPSDPRFLQFTPTTITTEYLYNPTLPNQTGNGVRSARSTSPGGQLAPTAVPRPTSTTYSLPAAPSRTQRRIRPLLQRRTTCSPRRSFATACWSDHGDTNLVVPQQCRCRWSQVQTPTVAHRDRKINLNFPLPISNDPAEPIRQKWCRETYQFLKAILPPAAVDTPEELAALSQYVVNIVDFRDTDCTMTRFVNTDLAVTDVMSKTTSPDPAGGRLHRLHRQALERQPDAGRPVRHTFAADLPDRCADRRPTSPTTRACIALTSTATATRSPSWSSTGWNITRSPSTRRSPMPVPVYSSEPTAGP